MQARNLLVRRSIRMATQRRGSRVVWNYRSQWPEEYPTEGALPKAAGLQLLGWSRDILSNFSIIGRTEELDDFVRSINQALGWPLEQRAEAQNVGTEDRQRSDFERYECVGPPTPRQLGRTCPRHFCTGSSQAFAPPGRQRR